MLNKRNLEQTTDMYSWELRLRLMAWRRLVDRHQGEIDEELDNEWNSLPAFTEAERVEASMRKCNNTANMTPNRSRYEVEDDEATEVDESGDTNGESNTLLHDHCQRR